MVYTEEDIIEITKEMSNSEIKMTMSSINNEATFLENEVRRLKTEMQTFVVEIAQNKTKIQFNTQPPHLLGTISELIPINEIGGETADEAEAHQKSQSVAAIVSTSARRMVFLPTIGLVDQKSVNPGDIVAVNKDSYLVLSKLPPAYDIAIKAMEFDTQNSNESFDNLGGIDEQIDQLREAIIFPIQRKDLFDKVGIKPPKGVLLHGPPGTGKTAIARAVAKEAGCTFLKLSGTELVQSYSGEGSRMVREIFELAKEKAPAIVFIDEIDAIGQKRFDSDQAGDRLVQRTMMELLAQMDGFEQNTSVKVLSATNRPELLDPALVRSGRFDRRIEFPIPNEAARVKILKIHSKNMIIDSNVNFDELSQITEDMNGAELRAVCAEAGIIALRRSHNRVTHDDFVTGVDSVRSQGRKKQEYNLDSL